MKEITVKISDYSLHNLERMENYFKDHLSPVDKDYCVEQALNFWVHTKLDKK